MIRTLAKSALAAVDSLRGPYRGPRILIYHQIGAGHGKQMDVSPDAFRSQLDWVGRTGPVVPLEDALQSPAPPADEGSYVLTFDDGYLDMYESGFPLLVERGLPFTLYLTSRPVETGQPLAPGGASTPLTWDQVGEMLASGLMTLGAHTHSHPDLRQMTEAQIEDDLGACDSLIERRTGVQPRHFTYPWGYWSAAADSVVRRRYATATLGGGGAAAMGADPFLVRRLPVQLSDNRFSFRQKMRHGQRTEEWVRRRLSGYDGP